MKKIYSLLILVILFFSCHDENPIVKFQKELITNEITGSNIAAVFQDDSLVYKHVMNSGKMGDMDITDETIFPIWSMSKPITTVAMMILKEQGLVDFQDPVHKYIPSFENLKCKGPQGIYPCNNTMKVIDLLTHRSGYTYYNEDGELKFINPQLAGQSKYSSSYRFNNLDDFAVAVSNQPLEFEPGSMYIYGINQAILGKVIESATGVSFYEYLKKNIFDKLGMNNTKFYLTKEERLKVQPLFVNFVANTPPWNPTDLNLKGFTRLLDEMSYDKDNRAHFGGEGLVSTFPDYMKFCNMLVNDGIYNGERVLSEESIDIMTSKYTEGYPNKNEPFLFPDQIGSYFGFTFYVIEDSEIEGSNSSIGTYGWAGYHNTHFWINPEKKRYGLFMSRSREFSFDIGKDFRIAVNSVY